MDRKYRRLFSESTLKFSLLHLRHFSHITAKQIYNKESNYSQTTHIQVLNWKGVTYLS